MSKRPAAKPTKPSAPTPPTKIKSNPIIRPRVIPPVAPPPERPAVISARNTAERPGRRVKVEPIAEEPRQSRKPERKPEPSPAKASGRKVKVQDANRDDYTDPIEIKTEAPLPERATRRRRVEVRDDVPDEHGDDSQTPRPNRLTRRAMPARDESQSVAISDGLGGAKFVRMLNKARRVVGVLPSFVAERLVDGYKFISGEPTVPLTGGPDDCVPGMRVVRARDYDRPENIIVAMELWRDAMLDDIENRDGNITKESLKGRNADVIIKRLTAMLDAPENIGLVYGVVPKGHAQAVVSYSM